MNTDINKKFEILTKRLIEQNISITAMESCTGGVIAALITDTEGASAIMKGSFVTYSNEAKIACGVPAETISRFGVYSEETARAMAMACQEAYNADIGIGVTGTFADPDPANADSVPGEVFIAVCFKDIEHSSNEDSGSVSRQEQHPGCGQYNGEIMCVCKSLKNVSAETRHETRMTVAGEAADIILEFLTKADI